MDSQKIFKRDSLKIETSKQRKKNKKWPFRNMEKGDAVYYFYDEHDEKFMKDADCAARLIGRRKLDGEDCNREFTREFVKIDGKEALLITRIK